jgi:CheY-like chemotaxis protein
MAKIVIPKVLVGWNVVVVEDDPDSQMVAKMMLERSGATVYTAENGQEGLELIRKTLPRFVLSDISMPIMDGWKLIHELNIDRRTTNIPVIALTAHAMHGDRAKAIQAGFINYMTKPLDPQKFTLQLLNLLVEIPDFADQLKEQYEALLVPQQ